MLRKAKLKVFLIGEHHDSPGAKLFVADNINALVEVGFTRVLLEGMLPETIPELRKHPSDKSNTLESYRALYYACNNNKVELKGTEDIQGRFLIETGMDPAHTSLMKLRERKFIEDIESKETKTIMIVGGGHISNLVSALLREGIEVVAMIIAAPGSEGDVMETCESVSAEKMLFQCSGLKVTLSLAEILSKKMHDMTKDVMNKMKEDTASIFPDERKILCQLQLNLSLFFVALNDEKFQNNLSTLEYLIGSLYAREEDYLSAIQYTKLSLARKKKYHASDEAIKKGEEKLSALTAMYQRKEESRQAITTSLGKP